MNESTTRKLKPGDLFCFDPDGSVFIVIGLLDETVSYELWCSHDQHDTLHDAEARNNTKVYILDESEAAKHNSDPGKQSS